jgi:hypothetical protein
MVFGFPGLEKTLAAAQCAAIRDAIQTRCDTEGGRQPSTADLLTGLLAMIK